MDVGSVNDFQLVKDLTGRCRIELQHILPSEVCYVLGCTLFVLSTK